MTAEDFIRSYFYVMATMLPDSDISTPRQFFIMVDKNGDVMVFMVHHRCFMSALFGSVVGVYVEQTECEQAPPRHQQRLVSRVRVRALSVVSFKKKIVPVFLLSLIFRPGKFNVGDSCGFARAFSKSVFDRHFLGRFSI